MSFSNKALEILDMIDQYDVVGKSYRFRKYYIVQRWDGRYHVYTDVSSLTIVDKDDLIKIIIEQFIEEELDEVLE